jgi:protein-tyrosine-phosphatase
MKIMFICTGNICRSAMAHWLMKKKLQEKNINNIEIYSSGIYAENGDTSTEEAIEVMEEYGVNLKQHKATNTAKSNIKEMDLILCMTASHKHALMQIYPNLSNKIYTLKEYVGINEIDIKDPWGYGIVTYRYCASEIDMCLDKLINKLQNEK